MKRLILSLFATVSVVSLIGWITITRCHRDGPPSIPPQTAWTGMRIDVVAAGAGGNPVIMKVNGVNWYSGQQIFTAKYYLKDRLQSSDAVVILYESVFLNAKVISVINDLAKERNFAGKPTYFAEYNTYPYYEVQVVYKIPSRTTSSFEIDGAIFETPDSLLRHLQTNGIHSVVIVGSDSERSEQAVEFSKLTSLLSGAGIEILETRPIAKLKTYN